MEGWPGSDSELKLTYDKVIPNQRFVNPQSGAVAGAVWRFLPGTGPRKIGMVCALAPFKHRAPQNFRVTPKLPKFRADSFQFRISN